MILVYDGTFESFLTLIYEVYYSKISVEDIKKEMPENLFMDDILKIENDEEKSLKVLDGLKNRFEKFNFETILNIFMCDSVSFEMDLLNYIVIGFKNQEELNDINNPSVIG